MADLTETSVTLPAVGTELDLPVVASATRTTVFAEQGVVMGTAELIEFAFLRNELRVVNQRGVVRGADVTGLQMESKGMTVISELCDVGHVRIGKPAALDLALAILKHLRNYGGTSVEEVTQRLTAEGFMTK